MKSLSLLFIFMLAVAVVVSAQMPAGQRDQFPGQTTPPTLPPDQTAPEKPSQIQQPDIGQGNGEKTPVDDQTLETRVREQLETNPDFSGIAATVLNGVVTLQGTVRSQEEENRARETAKSVAGVKRVQNRLTIQTKRSRIFFASTS